MFRLLLFGLLLEVSAHGLSPEEIDLSMQARGVLAHSCTKCHGQQKQKGGLRLDTKEAAFKGGEDGKTIVPGKPGDSELLRRVLLPRADEDTMPPKESALETHDVDILRKWISVGAPWPDGATAGVVFQRAPIAPRQPQFPPGTENFPNPVDRFVAAYFQQNSLPWADPVNDGTFLRRAGLDLVGLLPSWKELSTFDGHRDAAVDALLARKDDYAAHWLTSWNDALRNDYTGTGFITGDRRQISPWLYTALRDNKPFNAFVRELIAPHAADSDGFIKGILWRGSISAAQRPEMQAAQSISQAFLGLNLKCASCHDSFISDYKLKDAYALAAVYSDIPLPIERCDKPTGQTAGPGFFWPELGAIDAAKPKAERQQQLAEMLTRPENGRLARTLVNRLWGACFGRALIEPVDTMDNKPWSQDLLDWLAWDFVQSGWDVKHTLRLMVTSRTYALPSVAVGEPEALTKASFVFKGPVVRRLTAEQFTDVVSSVAAPLYSIPDLIANDPELAGAAAWIWNGEHAGKMTNFPEGKRYFRTSLELPAGKKIQRVAAVGTADNAFTLYVNGRETLTSKEWEKAVHAEMPPPGPTETSFTIAVMAENAAVGAAGLRLALVVWLEGQEAPLMVSTSPAWRTSATEVADWEKPGFDDSSWDFAVAVTPEPLWATTRGFRLTSEPLLVRASLVQNDAFQSALGRPNRDQITMSRPGQATLLQALNLSNGPTFDAALARAAKSWDARVPDPTERLVQIFRATLLREPRPEERALAGAPTGDLLWALLLQPEFQLIR